MPGKEQSTPVTEQPQNSPIYAGLTDDTWAKVFKHLPIREQVKLRQISKRWQGIVDGNRTSYGRMLTRECLLETGDADQAAPVRFRNTWVEQFRFKLNSDQLEFMSAVIDGNVAAVECLLKQHPEYARLKDKKGNLAIHYAAACGRVEIYKLLDENEKSRFDNSNLNSTFKNIYTRDFSTNKANEIPKDWIIRYGQLEKFKDYFQIPGNTKNLISLQISAARYGKVELLFDGGLLSDLAASEKTKPAKLKLLQTAALHGQREVIKRFTKDPKFDKAVLRKPDVLSVFHAAVRSGNEALVDDLLQIDLNLIDTESGRSTLDYAVLGGKLGMVKKIYQLEKARQPLESASYQMIDYAAQYGNLDILQYLLPILKDYHGEALKTAIEQFAAHKRSDADKQTLQRYQDIIVLLVNHHVNRAKSNRSYYAEILDRALGVAFNNNADELLPILINAGAKPYSHHFHAYRDTNQAEIAKLPNVRRNLVEAFQTHYAKIKEPHFILLVLGTLASIVLFIALGLVVTALPIGVAGYLLLTLVPMSTALQWTTIGVTAGLGFITSLTFDVFAMKPFYLLLKEWFAVDPVEEMSQRDFSLVTDVTPVHESELAKQYYWVPPKVAANPEASSQVAAAKSEPIAKVMDANSAGDQLESERMPARLALIQ